MYLDFIFHCSNIQIQHFRGSTTLPSVAEAERMQEEAQSSQRLQSNRKAPYDLAE